MPGNRHHYPKTPFPKGRPEKIMSRPNTAATTPTPPPLSETQETAVLLLSKHLLLPLDDLLAITGTLFGNEPSRQTVANCLKRHQVADIRDRQFKKADGTRTTRKTFNTYDPGLFHLNVETLPEIGGERVPVHLFVAIDRATRWACFKLLDEKSARSATTFLHHLQERAPFRIRQILTNDGPPFSANDANDERTESPFPRACAQLDIEQRFLPDQQRTGHRPDDHQRRLRELLALAGLDDRESLNRALNRFERAYNETIRQTSLKHITPAQALDDWKKRKPELFKKKVYRLTGRDVAIIAFLWFGTCLFFASMAVK